MPSSASGSAETLPGSAIGTPAYMSPEQAAGDLERLGPRSDVYSLGATLYCLLTGKPPFEADDLGAVLAAVQQGRLPAPAIGRPLDRPRARGRLPEGDGDQARGPPCELPGPGRRRRALGGRRAGLGLARAVRAPRAALGESQPVGGHGGRGRRAGRRRRPVRRAGGPVAGQRDPHGQERRAGRGQPARGRGQRPAPRGQHEGPGPLRPGPRGDPLVPGRRQRGRHAQGRGAEGSAEQAAPLGRRDSTRSSKNCSRARPTAPRGRSWRSRTSSWAS